MALINNNFWDESQTTNPLCMAGYVTYVAYDHKNELGWNAHVNKNNV